MASHWLPTQQPPSEEDVDCRSGRWCLGSDEQPHLQFLLETGLYVDDDPQEPGGAASPTG